MCLNLKENSGAKGLILHSEHNIPEIVFPALKDGVFYEQLTYFDIPEYEALKS
jgi:hypothetical protein